ncbi:MAG: ABC transporter substrate-binding protein [Acidimicrobiales bacterium]
MKFRFIAALVAALGMFAAACGSETATTASVTGSDSESAETTAAPTTTDATPTTAAPTTAETEMDSMRIVSINPTATEMLFAIGAGDQVVAVDAFSYYPPEAPVTDLSGWDPNVEAIAGFEPDVVISDAPVEGLEALGIENVVISAATSLDDIYSQIGELGEMTGTADGALTLVDEMQGDIADVLASLPQRDEALTYYHELDNTLYSVTSGTFVGYVYSLLGLENVADPADADGAAFGYPQLNEEFLVAADPDIIFLADTLCCEQNAETVAARAGWDQLSAVQNGNIVELNDDIVSRWGPRIVEFIETAGTAVAGL